MELVKMIRDADSVEHPARIGRIPVGEDEAASGKTRKQADQPLVAPDPVERDVVDVGEEIMRVNAMFLHQPGKRRPMLVEMGLLNSPCLLGTAVEEALDVD